MNHPHPWPLSSASTDRDDGHASQSSNNAGVDGPRPRKKMQNIEKASPFPREKLHALLSAIESTPLAFGSSCETVLLMVAILGDSYINETGDDCAALACYMTCLKVEQSCVAIGNSALTLTILTKIASIFRGRSDYANALRTYKSMCELQQHLHGANSWDVAETLSCIALMHYRLNSNHNALEAYQKALVIRRDLYFDLDHLEVATNMNSLGLVLHRIENFDLAKQSFSAALSMRQRLLGSYHRDVATVWFNLATVHFDEGQDSLALLHFEAAIRIQRVVLGDNHPDLAATLEQVAHVKRLLGKMEDALLLFMDALSIHRSNNYKCGADQRRRIANVLNSIGSLYIQKDYVPNMMVHFTEAARILSSDDAWEEDGTQEHRCMSIAWNHIYSIRKMRGVCAAVA